MNHRIKRQLEDPSDSSIVGTMFFFTILLMFLAIFLGGCNTLKGAALDVMSAGEGMARMLLADEPR